MSTPAAPPEITALLKSAAEGDRAALDAVFAALYPDLKRVAHARLYAQGHGAGLHTTTLVHESFLKLAQSGRIALQDRRHFFAYAAKTMRNIIVDSVREQLAERRGAGAEHITLSSAELLPLQPTSDGDQIMRVHDALAELEALDAELAQVVEMRYFGGYTEVEIGELLGVTERTVRRRWDKGRAWLFVALGGSADKPE
jgi:RNA polymerase sigma factor (TIGR02999 family)